VSTPFLSVLRVWTAAPTNASVAAIVVTLVVGLACGGGGGGGGGSNAPAPYVPPPPPPPAPSFQLTDQKLVDCSTLMDVCYSVACEVANTGNGSGTAMVTFHLSQGNDITAEESKLVMPNERVKFNHKFPEARLGGGQISGYCTVEEEPSWGGE
jgi:hypothetical protein